MLLHHVPKEPVVLAVYMAYPRGGTLVTSNTASITEVMFEPKGIENVSLLMGKLGTI